MVYISEQGKKHLRSYKYTPADDSLITPILNKYLWEPAVVILPMWMAPNLVTFIAFLHILLAFGLNIYYMPDLQGLAPGWVYWTIAICVFNYQTLDALDGKQARRTKGGSALGELFDHGCDAISATLLAVNVASAIQVGNNWLAILLVASVTTIFYYSIWEQYYTHVIHFSSFAGPTEGQIVAMLVNIVTCHFGTEVWLKPWFSIYIPGLNFTFEMNFSLFVSLQMIIGPIFTTLVMIKHILFEYKMSDEERARKGHPLVTAFPHIFLTVTFFAYLYISPLNVASTHTLWVATIYGLVCGYITTRTCLSRVIGVTSPFFFLMLIPFPLLLANAIAGAPISEIILLIGTTVYVIIVYLHMALGVINEICDFLGIHCFSLKTRLDENKLK